MKPRASLTAAARVVAAAAATAAAALLASCSAAPPPAGSPAAPNSQVTGTLGNGTSWVAEYPQGWNGTLLLYSHGYGPLSAADAPNPQTAAALLAAGYALAGSSYDPHGSQWALNTAVSDQFGALASVESTALPRPPGHVLAFGTSMGGLVSALEAQDSRGRIDGALTTCGGVAGGVSLSQYQLQGEYAIAELLGDPATRLTGLDADSAASTSATLTADAQRAQRTPAGQARLALAMAFLNIPTWDPASPAPAPAGDPAAQEAAQYQSLTSGTSNAIAFMISARMSLEQAVGQAAWTAGTDFASALNGSPYAGEVKALYQAAGLNLPADLTALTAHAGIKADPAALDRLRATSQPTGRLEVPELDLHTVADSYVPVQQESSYARLVERRRQRRTAPPGLHRQPGALRLQPVRGGRRRAGAAGAGDIRPLGRHRHPVRPAAGGRRAAPGLGAVHRVLPRPADRRANGAGWLTARPARDRGSTLGLMPAAEPAPLLLYLLKQVELGVRARMDEIVRPAGLTAVQYTAMTVLERHAGLSSAQLARLSFVTAQSMADVVTSLEALGLIERQRDAADRRRLAIALTANGRVLLDRQRDKVTALERDMLSGLTGPEVTGLRAALNTCRDNLSRG